MRPANFPGRKNERRTRALAQLTRAKNTKAERLDRPPHFDRAAEKRALLSIIVDEATARNIRTKKDRSSRARVRL